MKQCATNIKQHSKSDYQKKQKFGKKVGAKDLAKIRFSRSVLYKLSIGEIWLEGDVALRLINLLCPSMGEGWGLGTTIKTIKTTCNNSQTFDFQKAVRQV